MKKTLATTLFAAIFMSVTAQQMPNALEILEKAGKLQEEKKYTDAINLYKLIHQNDSNYYRGLYEITNCYYADSQYNKALEYSSLGISAKSDQRPSFFNLHANILDDMGEQDKAKNYYDSAIQIYPGYISPYLNSATILIKNQKFAEAETLLQKAAFQFPFSAALHYKLGIVSLNQGKIIQAFLSLNHSILVEPAGGNLKNAVAILSSMAKGDDEVLDYYQKRNQDPDANYALVEEMFVSRIALDPKFKINTELEDAITRQYQMIIQKLEYKKDDKDFYVQYYLPFLKDIFSTKQYNAYCNYLFSGLNIEQIASWLKKNKKEIAAMTESANNYFQKVRASREWFAHQRNTTGPWHYENGVCFAKGKFENKLALGYWEFYFPNGNIRSKGQYDANGKQTGEWTYYNDNTTLNARQNFVNGQLQGPNTDYHENGTISRNAVFTNGHKQGENHDYFPNGNLKSVQIFEKGKESGILKFYYAEGVEKSVVHASNGEIDGKMVKYYTNGRLESEVIYSMGKLSGKYKSWYTNGNIYAEGVYENDKQTGTWKFYHENGKLKSVQQFVEGELDGEVSEFHDNSQLSSKQVYRKGKSEGENVYYSRDGKMYSKLIYASGKLKEANYFDPSGKLISKTETRGKSFDLDAYSSWGTKKSTGKFNEKGISSGEEIDYWSSGAIYSKLNYVDGTITGPAKYFFNNGKPEQEIIYSANGEKNGLFREYYKHGGLYCDGYFVANIKEGVWNYYDDFGHLRSRTYFLAGEKDGIDETYYQNGKPEFRQLFSQGSLIASTQYDTTGKIISNTEWKNGTGKFQSHHLNGSVFANSRLQNGFLHGAYESFYFDGKPYSKEFQYFGVADSTYQIFYHNGNVQQDGKYYRGEKIGTWKYFNEDGTMYLKEDYVHGKLHGKRIFYNRLEKPETETIFFHGRKEGWQSRYSEDGSLINKIRYSDDVMVEYTYEDKTGELVTPISLPGGNGKVASFFRNGNPSAKANFVDGDYKGEVIYYHSNGKISYQANEDFNLTEGTVTGYYDNGQVKEKINYLHNDFHGPYQSFYPDGNPRVSGNYYLDQKHGEWTSYNKDGKAIETSTYYYGRLINLKKL